MHFITYGDYISILYWAQSIMPADFFFENEVQHFMENNVVE